MITQNDIDILNLLHNRLVEKYKESPNVDYLIKAREVIGYLQQELVSGVIASHEQALPIQRVSNLVCDCIGCTEVHQINGKFICGTCNRPLAQTCY